MSENESKEVTGNPEESTDTAVETDEAVATDEAVETDAAEEDFQFVEAPTFDIDYQGDCAYAVKVSVPAVNTSKKAAELLGELQEQAELPGFRKGRAPLKLVENKFGKAARGDATEKAVSAAFRKLIEEQDLKPLGFPDIDGLEDALEKSVDQDLEFTFKFEVGPRCTLGEYKGIEVERPVVEVADKDIQGAIDEVRERAATYEPAEGAEAAEGDQVIIDFKGVIDGEAFAGGAAENYPYILGSGRFFAQFEETLKGAKAGDELTCQVPFPEDYSNPELAGKTADFTINVHEIKRKVLPELDDDFAKNVGAESAEDLRKRVADQLREGSSSQSDEIAQRVAIGKVVDVSTFELPKSLVDSSAEEYYQQEVRRLSSLRVSAAELAEREEDIRKEAHQNALLEIKSYVAVNEIGQVEGITVTDEDFEKEASNIQQRTGMGMDVVQRFLAQSEQRDSYETRIFRQKALAALMAHAKVIDKVVDRDELDKESDE